MRIIRLSAHPTDPEVVVLSTPPEMSKDMGRFEPARYSPDLRAYLTHRDTIPTLHAFAKHVHAHVTDERRSAGEPTLPHECRRCAQPGSVSKPPRFCPGCGSEWEPVTFHEAVPASNVGTCLACGHRQSGKFPRCSQCGGQMHYEPGGKRVQLPRPKLPEPMALADVVPDVLADIERASQEDE